MSFYDVISERLAALTGSSTAVEARDALNEFNVRDIQAVSVSQGAGGSGGSQTLAEVLAAGGDPGGNPITGVVRIENPDPAVTSAIVKAPTGQATLFGVLQAWTYENGNSAFEVDLGEYGGGQHAFLVLTDGQTSATTRVLSDQGFVTNDEALGYKAYRADSSRIFAALDSLGVLVGVTAAPADEDINAGECSMWFDQTDGAAKIKFKGKSADGTVATGQVALS